jgi:hypothetical protein
MLLHALLFVTYHVVGRFTTHYECVINNYKHKHLIIIAEAYFRCTMQK